MKYLSFNWDNDGEFSSTVQAVSLCVSQRIRSQLGLSKQGSLEHRSISVLVVLISDNPPPRKTQLKSDEFLLRCSSLGE